jgi:myo-inositol-1(or 4)-monophosphatase
MTEAHRDRAATAERAATAGGEVALSLFRSDLDVERKGGKTDVVTRADRQAQDAVADVIHGVFPGETVVGEEDENRTTVPASGPAWIVDPIDGTNNYVRELRAWATAVAAMVDGEPVGAASALPALGDIYTATPEGAFRNGDPITVSDRTDPERFAVTPTIWWDLDRRDEYAAAAREIVTRFGDLVRVRCAQAALAMVAAGSLDAVVTNLETNPWDTVAGAYMIEQADGTVTDLDGNAWQHDATGLVASNGTRHDEVLAAARAVTDVADGD